MALSLDLCVNFLFLQEKITLTNLVEKVTYFFQNVTLRSTSVVISLRAGG